MRLLNYLRQRLIGRLMSQYRNSSIQPSQSTVNNEEFYDLHPAPYNVDKYSIGKHIKLYVDFDNIETFLVEITFDSWQEAKYEEAKLTYLMKNSDVDVYRNRKYLFLRRLLF